MYVHITWIYATYVLLHVLGFNTKYILPLFSGRGWLIWFKPIIMFFLSRTSGFTPCLLWGSCFYAKLHAFTSFLFPCFDFRETQCSFFLDSPLFSNAFNVLFVLFVFIYIQWCPTRFSYHNMLVLFNSNTAGVINRADSTYPSEHLSSLPVLVRLVFLNL